MANNRNFAGVKNMEEVFGGVGRLLWAEAGTAKPAKIADILNPLTGELATGWHDYGATDGGLTKTRSADKTEWTCDQEDGVIDEKLTKWNMGLETSLIEVSQDNIKHAWSVGETTINTVDNESTIGITAPSAIEERMIAFVVNKRDNLLRSFVYWRTKYNGEDTPMEFKKEDKWLLPLKLSILIDPTEEVNKFGIVIDQLPE